MASETAKQRTTETERIGLLGGTFDPLHNGHLAVARTVRARLGLDRLLLIPASRPPHKLSAAITDFGLRAAMIEAALGSEPGLELCLIEQDTNGPSFSIDTLRRLAAASTPGRCFYFIIGADAFCDIPSWKRFADIPRLTNLVVVNREETALHERPAAVIARHFPDFRLHDDGIWRAAGCGDIVPLTMPRVDISSTLVRDLVRADRDISALVPAPVAELIARHGLYR